MKIVIVICLLIVIALLLQDKIVIKKRSEQKPMQKKINPNLPDIMGQPKPVRNISVPNTANESRLAEQEINPDNLDIEYDKNVSIQIPQEELDEVFSNIPDLEEEEKEWNRFGISDGNDSFRQGVTYDELSSVGAILQKENLDQAQKATAVVTVQKLKGTELFNLLEDSMEGSSQKIAELLESTLSAGTDRSSSAFRKSNLGDFDIGEFV